MDNRFVIAIGGSGIRSLTSFIHLCASGCIKEERIRILVIDTDRENGNTNELRKLHGYYEKCRQYLKDYDPNDKRIFYTELNLTMCTQLSEDINSLRGLVKKYKSKSDEEVQPDDYNEAIRLATAVFGEDALDQNFNEGFYGQPSVGATVFCYCVNKNKDIKDFTEEILISADQQATKLLLLGSVFGGTGAAGIMSYLQYLNNCLASPKYNNSWENIKNSLQIAGTFLLPYMKFIYKEDNQDVHYINSNDFEGKALNVMQYFEELREQEKNYKGNCHISNRYFVDCHELTIRGNYAQEGMNQRNWPHLAELMAAISVKTFFESSESGKDYYLDNNYFSEFAWEKLAGSTEEADVTCRLIMLLRTSMVFQDIFYEELFPLSVGRQKSAKSDDIYWYFHNLCRADVKVEFDIIFNYFKMFSNWIFEINYEYESTRALPHMELFDDEIIRLQYQLTERTALCENAKPRDPIYKERGDLMKKIRCLLDEFLSDTPNEGNKIWREYRFDWKQKETIVPLRVRTKDGRLGRFLIWLYVLSNKQLRRDGNDLGK